MENQPSSPQAPIGMQPVLPNSTAALVLGIISIPTCFCFGIPGMVCGIIAILMGSKAIKLYKQSPGIYSISSYNNANAGKICGIVGVSLSSLYFLYIIIYFILMGTLITSVFSSMPWGEVK